MLGACAQSPTLSLCAGHGSAGVETWASHGQLPLEYTP